MSTLKNANLLALADKLKKSIAQDPSRKEMLYQHFSKVLDQRFVRNSSVQSFLYSAISVAIVLTMIAFPPSMVIFASVAFLSIVLKFGWDMYRMHQKNKAQEELEEKIFPTKVEIKSSTTQPQDAAIKQPTPTIAAPEDTKSAFISHKKKFKEILSTDQSVITPSKR